MLFSIDLQLTPTHGDILTETRGLPGTDSPVGGFAELLNQPATSTELAGDAVTDAPILPDTPVLPGALDLPGTATPLAGLNELLQQSGLISDFNSDLAGETQELLDTDAPLAEIAGFLNLPVGIADPTPDLEAGQGLPAGGNVLPSVAGDALLLPDQIAQRLLNGEGMRPAVVHDGLPRARVAAGIQTAADANPLIQTAALQNPSTQALTAATVIDTQQVQRDVLPSGSAALAADLDKLLAKTTATDPLRNTSEAVVQRVTASGREALSTNALDKINAALRPAANLTADAIKEIRPPVSPVSPGFKAESVERLLGPAPTPAASTTLLSSGIASPATTASHAPLATSATSASPLPSPINVPVQDAAWGDALSDRVLFMTGQKVHSAEIRLNPAELGPITIKVAVDDGAADVTFIAHHAVAREAIELAMPRLRDLLGQNGLALGNASVAEQGVEHNRKGQQGPEVLNQHGDVAEPGADDAITHTVAMRAPQGLVDTFV